MHRTNYHKIPFTSLSYTVYSTYSIYNIVCKLANTIRANDCINYKVGIHIYYI